MNTRNQVRTTVGLTSLLIGLVGWGVGYTFGDLTGDANAELVGYLGATLALIGFMHSKYGERLIEVFVRGEQRRR